MKVLNIIILLWLHIQGGHSSGSELQPTTTHECSFGSADTEDWCGYTQTHNIAGLEWQSMTGSNGNRFVGVEMYNHSVTGGRARLVSPVFLAPGKAEHGCLIFRQLFAGSGLTLLHVVVNIFTRSTVRYDQWYQRRPLGGRATWRRQQLSIQLPLSEQHHEQHHVYVQLSIDVTSSPTSAGPEAAYATAAVDDIHLDLQSKCEEETTPKSGGYREETTEQNKGQGRESGGVTIRLATSKPESGLTIIKLDNTK